MKRSFLLFISLFLIFSCGNPDDDPSSKSVDVLLSESFWELEQYSNIDNTRINDSQLTTDAKYLYVMFFEFKNDNETRALDKVSKNILNNGTWALNDNNTTIDIDVTGFKGNFTIVSIDNKKLVLQAPTDNFLSTLGDKVNLEFNAVAK